MKKLALLITLLFVISIFNSCNLPGDGSNTLVRENPNKNHTKKAVLFLRQAGATVADSYQVTITNYKTEFDTVAIGNTFTVDDNHGEAYLSPKCIDLNWVSDNTLEIIYDKKLRTFIQEKFVNGITVIYKTK